jgi:CheY-like chemotaxis protein
MNKHRPLKILLVDDNSDDNYFHTRTLNKLACVDEIDTCFDGVDALEYFEGKGKYADRDATFRYPDIIFLDINMPRMDGWEFLQCYKKLELTGPILPVIVMLSTSLNPVDKERADDDEVIVDFCSKPLSVDSINMIFEKHL